MNAAPRTDMPAAESPGPLRSLLEEVAAGRLDPDEASRRLAGITPPPEPSLGLPPGLSSGAAAAITRLEILADAMDLRVIADPSLDLIHVDGWLEVEPDGEVLRLRPPTRSPEGNAYRFGSIGGLMAGWLEGLNHRRVVVRARPDLAVSIAGSGSKLAIEGMQGGFTVRLAAGAFRASDVRGPFSLDLESSTAKLSALLDHGISRVRGLMSTVDLSLASGSDVAISAAADMGSVRIDGQGQKPRGSALRESIEATVGEGAASIDLSMQMGTIKVVTP